MIRDARGASVLALDGQGSRIIAQLSVAYERAVPVSVVDTLRKASDLWSRGLESARPCSLELLPRAAHPAIRRPWHSGEIAGSAKIHPTDNSARNQKEPKIMLKRPHADWV